MPEEALACPHCGKLAAMMSATEDSELLEIEVRAHRRRIRRRRYRASCDCDRSRRTLTAPPPPKLIPKGNDGISIWTHVLVDKYSSYRPTERLLGQLEQYDLDLPAGTVIYLLDSSRGHEVPEAHFGPEAAGVLEVDRYSGYKAMAQVKAGLIVLAFCWAHVRRDFVGVGKGWPELVPWALQWLRRLRQLYGLNRERLQHALGSSEFQQRDALLRQAVGALRVQANFPIPNSASHAARFWRACKSTGPG